MKNQINSYAQARISFYEASLQRKNTPQLVDEFNQLAQSRGWTAERSYFPRHLSMKCCIGISISQPLRYGIMRKVKFIHSIMPKFD